MFFVLLLVRTICLLIMMLFLYIWLFTSNINVLFHMYIVIYYFYEIGFIMLLDNKRDNYDFLRGKHVRSSSLIVVCTLLSAPSSNFHSVYQRRTKFWNRSSSLDIEDGYDSALSSRSMSPRGGNSKNSSRSNSRSNSPVSTS